MKRLALLVLVSLLVLPIYAFAQAPDTLWTRTYGIPGRINECWDAIGLPDGGLAIAGTSTEAGYLSRLYVVRINSDGDTLWTRTFDDASVGRSICQTSDNGFIISGYIVTGAQTPFVLKIDSSGNEIWSRVYAGWTDGMLRSVQPVGDDGYILAGYFMSDPPYNVNALVVRINSEGDTLWSREYGGGNMEMAWSVQPTADGGFIVAGWTESFGNGGSDFYIIKTDSNGDSIWTRTYGDVGNDETREIIETNDGSFVFSGKSTGTLGYPLYSLMKIDSQGDSVWAHTYSGPPMFHRIIHSFTQTVNGDFALLGYNIEDNIDLIKTNSAGDSIWSTSFVDNPTINFKSRSVIQSQDGSYFLCGNNYQDIWVVKLAPEITGIDDSNVSLPKTVSLHQNYPNPFNASTKISFSLAEPENVTLSVYDLLGRKVRILTDGYLNAGDHHVVWNAEEYNSGIYFYHLKGGDINESRSMILLK